MTNSSNNSIFPTDWHPIDATMLAECRQLSADTFQVRSSTHVITLNKEGFNLYRVGTPEGFAEFELWAEENGVAAFPRDDL